MIGVEETIGRGRYVVALQDIPAGTPVHMSTPYAQGRYIPAMRVAPGNNIALYPNRECSHCTKTIVFGGEEGKQCKSGYGISGVTTRCAICRALCYCSDDCRLAHSQVHRDSLECLSMGLILKGRTWYDQVYFPTYMNQPSLLASSSYGIPRKRPPPVSATNNQVIEIVNPILPISLFEREVFPFLMMMSMMLLRASKELVVEKPVDEVVEGTTATIREKEEEESITKPLGGGAAHGPIPVVVYSGLAREVPYCYLGSKYKKAGATTPSPSPAGTPTSPADDDAHAFPTTAGKEGEGAVSTSNNVTETSIIIPAEAERISKRFREIGGVEVVDSEAMEAMLEKKEISSLVAYMNVVLQNSAPTLGKPSSSPTAQPVDPTSSLAEVNFTDPTSYVAPAWGDVAALTTNLSSMRKDGPFGKYRTFYRLYQRCRIALSRCNSAQVVPVDGKPVGKRSAGRKPGMKPSKTPEEIAALKEAREAKRRKVEKKDTTTEEERSLDFLEFRTAAQPNLSDNEEEPPAVALREIDRFADSLLPYISESMFLSLCAAIQCNTFGITNSSDNTMGFTCFPFSSYFNHSCEPNLSRVMVHTKPNGTDTVGKGVKLVQGGFERASFYTLWDIKKGEELNISYVTTQDEGSSRRQHLLKNYRFYCQCSRCSMGNKKIRANFCDKCPAGGYLIPKEGQAEGGDSFCSVCSK